MPLSEAQKRSNAKHDKENWQYITFKARIGSKDRIVEAANATGVSINGFIRDAISKAVMEVINKPLEPTHDDAAKTMLLRILNEEVNKLYPYELGRMSREELEKNYANIIESEPSLYEEITKVLSSDLPAKTKGKEIRDVERKKRKDIQSIIRDNINNY